MADLTSKQQAFCEAYVSNGFNGTQAAITAGYSQDTANRMASENMTKPVIAEYIAKFKESATERALVTIEDVVRGLMEEAKGSGEDTSTSARVAAWKALTDYTGGFDQNKIRQENVNIEMSHEEWLESLK